SAGKRSLPHRRSGPTRRPGQGARGTCRAESHSAHVTSVQHGASSPSPDELSWNRFTLLEAGSQTIEQRIVPDSASIHIAHGSGPLRPLQHVQTKTKSDFSEAKIFRAQSLRPPHACGCRNEAGVRGASFMTAAQKYPNGTASFAVRSSRRRERARNSITTT